MTGDKRNNVPLNLTKKELFNDINIDPSWKGDPYELPNIESEVLNKYSSMPTSPEALSNVFSKFDSSMKETLLEIAKYKSGLPNSKDLIAKLFTQYEACQFLSEWARNRGIDEPYFFKQTDMGTVRNILIENGYLNEEKKR